MSYTVFDTSVPQTQGVVVSSVIEALWLARQVEREAEIPPIIASDNGWTFSVDELEELART